MDKPTPRPNAISQPFFDACNRGELMYQHCRACDHAQYYPRARCTSCSSDDLEWLTSAGRGVVYSHTTVLRAPNAAFAGDVPYSIAVIDLDEGFRVVTNVLAPPDTVTIGAVVHAVFEDRGGQRLLQFEPVG